MKTAAKFEDTVRRSLQTVKGLSNGIVVAVSGGPDSVALLRALLAVCEWSIPLTMAHLNHQLRGDASDADEQFVLRLHAALSVKKPNLSVRTTRCDVASRAAAEKSNLEATARALRYRWFAEIALEQGARWVATGHTADDQAETVLHRLLRGTGLQGLRGIAEKRSLDEGIGLVRPLLHLTRSEVLAYLRQLGQHYCEDDSNSDVRFTRNRIRSELLPHLAEHFNPAIVSVLGRLAEQVDEAHRHQEAEATTLLRVAELPRAGSMLVFDAERLKRAPRLLLRVLFRLVWEREAWPTGRMDFASWERLARLIIDGAEDGGDFPGGVHAQRRGWVVQVDRRKIE